MSEKLDQDEVLAEIEQLRLKSANLRAQLSAKGVHATAPALSAGGTDMLADHKILTQHVADLEAQLAGKSTGTQSATAKPMTLTEKVLAAKAAQKRTRADELD